MKKAATGLGKSVISLFVKRFVKVFCGSSKICAYPLSGNFVCKEAGGSCECKDGWTGTDCDQAICKEECEGKIDEKQQSSRLKF